MTAAALVACLSLIFLNAPALAQPGALDTTFGADGKVTTNFDPRWSAFDESWDVALQTDGKIVAAGKTGGRGRFALARYHMDGTLDHSFGGDGKVTTFPAGDDESLLASLSPLRVRACLPCFEQSDAPQPQRPSMIP